MSKPTQQESVGVGGASQGYHENKGEEIEQEAASATWGTGQSGGESWNWDVPAKQILRNVENRGWYSRYATFDATVRFEGHIKYYRATFLFGSDGHTAKQLPLDMIVSVGALNDAPANKYFPNVFLTKHFRQRPGVEDWLRSKADPNCPRGEVCCNPETLKCALSKEDVDAPPKSWSVLLPTELRNPRLLLRRIDDGSA